MLFRSALILVMVCPPVRVIAGICCVVPQDDPACAVSSSQSDTCCAATTVEVQAEQGAYCTAQPADSCCVADNPSAHGPRVESGSCAVHSAPGPCCDKCPCCLPVPPLVPGESLKTQVRPLGYPLFATVGALNQRLSQLSPGDHTGAPLHPPDSNSCRQARLAVWLN